MLGTGRRMRMESTSRTGKQVRAPRGRLDALKRVHPVWRLNAGSSHSRSCSSSGPVAGHCRRCTSRTSPGGGSRSASCRRALRRPPPVPPQRPLVLARRPAAGVRPAVRERRTTSCSARLVGPGADAADRPPAAADQARLQPRPVRARGLARDDDHVLAGRPGDTLGPQPGSRVFIGDAGERASDRRC